ncbi:carboxylesterase family protein [Marinilactibacillus psychrotolerans]|uniref:Carboxylic ester hydrolase n=1 Tax=Marinilactibacillus psychrotolerans TaxID=191770 RepID=A0ABW8UPJ4_9LACT
MYKETMKIGLSFALVGLVLSGCTTNDETKTSTETVKEVEQTSDGTIRETEFGQVQGVNENGVYKWMGIPYGGDTSGENRWKAPTDPESWSDIRDATEPGDSALQLGTEGADGSEDALNLDIYRPENDKEALPVLVFVHGGNNQTGLAQEISGASFARNQDAIVVSVNYRLGALGFNPLPALKTGTSEENSGNYTMLDLEKSLEWVRLNIEQFGGDSENVTVSGFSAGGRDVMAMLISPIFEGKFDKAISFSGGMTIADEEKSQDVFAEAMAPLVVEDGVQEAVEAAKEWLLTDDEAVKEYLVELEGDRLVNLMGNAGIRMNVFPHLYNDGTVIPKEGFDTENYNDVPILMLTGGNEFSLFGRFDPYFGEYVADGSIDTDDSISAQYDFINQYGGQLYSLFNVEESAEKMAEHYDESIYGMEINFGEDAPVVGEDMAKFGSFHGVFVPLLDTKNENYAALVGDAYKSEGAVELSEWFQRYIYEFMENGDPNSDQLPEWKKWTKENKEVLFLDADQSTAKAELGQMDYTYTDVLNAIEADTTISEEEKEALISEVLNSRWFSRELDEKYDNLSDFDK